MGSHEAILHAVLVAFYTAAIHTGIFIASEAEHQGPIKVLGIQSLPAVCTYVQTPTPLFRLYKYAA